MLQQPQKADPQAATFVMLTFTTQTNVIRGEKIGHKASGNPLLCPKSKLLWSVLNLRSNGAAPYTPLYCIMMPTGRRKKTMPTMISKTLKTAVMFCGAKLGFEAKEVFTCSLRAVGSIMLLCSGVNSNTIKLISQW